MPFEKGNKLGRPQGSKQKTQFIVRDVLNKRFPDRIAQLESFKASAGQSPLSPGKSCFLDYMQGKRLTARQTLIANCFDCCGQYVDGKKDCENPLCVCYPFMPYRLKD